MFLKRPPGHTKSWSIIRHSVELVVQEYFYIVRRKFNIYPMNCVLPEASLYDILVFYPDDHYLLWMIQQLYSLWTYCHQRDKNEVRNTKFNRGQETHPKRVNAGYEMNWAKKFRKSCLQMDGRTDGQTSGWIQYTPIPPSVEGGAGV